MTNQKEGIRKYDQENLFDGNPSGYSNYSREISSEEREIILGQLERAKEKGLEIKRISDLISVENEKDVLRVRSRAIKDLSSLSDELLKIHGDKPLLLHSFKGSWAREIPDNLKEEYDKVFHNNPEDLINFLSKFEKKNFVVIRYAI